MTGMLTITASAIDIVRDVQATDSAFLKSLAPQLRAIKAVAATDIPISSACTKKNMRCPVVTAATELVPSSATILICMKPTVVNSRLEIIVGHAKRQTLRLVELELPGVEVGN